MNDFAYVRAESVAQAADLLAEDPEGTRLLAGGTDLIVFLTEGKLAPRRLVDVKPLGLAELTVNGGLTLGGLARLREIERHPAVVSRWQALAQGAREVGGVAIRNRATLAGNLGTASPAADTPPALLALGAELEIVGPAGGRRLPLTDYFIGPGRHALAPGELITAIRLPDPGPRSGSQYLKLATRRAMDIAFVGVAAYVRLAVDGTVAAARVGLGAVAPTPLLACAAGDLLVGRPLDDEAVEAAAQAAMAASSPITDHRCSAEYRRAMVGELTRRALRLAAAQAGEAA